MPSWISNLVAAYSARELAAYLHGLATWQQLMARVSQRRAVKGSHLGTEGVLLQATFLNDLAFFPYFLAKAGTGIAAMSVMRPELIMKSIIPVVMAGLYCTQFQKKLKSNDEYDGMIAWRHDIHTHSFY